MRFTDWDTLRRRIKYKECVPFVGAGACTAFLPLGGDLAQQLATDFDYRLADKDLARVTEFVAVTKGDGKAPKYWISQKFQALAGPNPEDEGDIHRVLASLDLPIYLTTNYDDFMFKALLAAGKKDTKREVCRWNKLLLEQEPSAFDSGYEPTPAIPVVFHLHGHADLPRSIVVTEDDYLDFLVNISQDLAVSPTGTQQRARLPVRIRRAIQNATLLFVGYRLADLNFRVILRSLAGFIEQSNKTIHIAVQVPPDEKGAEEEVKRTQDYLEQYFNWTLNLQVYWGRADKFAGELRQAMRCS